MMMIRSIVTVVVLLVCPGGASGQETIPDYDFDWVTIGEVGNVAYGGGPYVGTWAGRGCVDYEYRISRLEVTSAQWLDFINIFAPQSNEPLSFLQPTFSGLQSDPAAPAGYYRFFPDIVNAGMVPVIGITWRDAAMYCNWLHNDKSTAWAAIMSGAYDASTFGYNPDGTFTDQLTHSLGAKFWIPTLDEWLKAAHYDPNRWGPGMEGWWDYSNSSDLELIPGPPGIGQTSAGEFNSPILTSFIPLGSYPEVQSPWGLLDLSGGAAEWTEEVNFTKSGPYARSLDGSWAGSLTVSLDMDAIYITNIFSPTFSAWGGLRIVSAVPGPGCVADISPPSGNGAVSIDDLVALLNTFGPCSPPQSDCLADITPIGGNGVVNIDDLVALLNSFGPCP